MAKDLDLVSKLDSGEQQRKMWALLAVCPDDGKYEEPTRRLEDYLTPKAEWLTCIKIQRALLETRVEFDQAADQDLKTFDVAVAKADALNISLLEDNVTRHDQLAVLEELGRYMLEIVKAKLHPGTTSYDILDTARAHLFKTAWKKVIRPEIVRSVRKIADLAERFLDEDEKAYFECREMPFLQTGRTHLQNTSPVPFGATLALYAARLEERTRKADLAFNDLKGKISGITGTGAGIDMIIGSDHSIEFERRVLEKLDLEPDYTATQIVQKERLADVGHSLVTLMHVLGDFANDIRILYSSAIGEVTSRDNAQRLGGSSADAAKNNPVHWENIAGKNAVVESGMRVLYEMIHSDLQRDLRGSVQARYQPQMMMTETFEAFSRLNDKALPQLSVNQDRMAENLKAVRRMPSEAMTSILRGEECWVHSKYGLGHDFVREMSKAALKDGRPLLEVALEDSEFRQLYDSLPGDKQQILQGRLELYIGSAFERAKINIASARSLIS
ncbi:MAG: lyase family protein [Nanoarchaeota archaeon]